jgi:hypothetical protein
MLMKTAKLHFFGKRTTVEPDLIPRQVGVGNGGGLVYLAGHTHSIIFEGLLGTKQRMGAYMCLTKAFLHDRSV